ncbi:MAG: hypothetical protein IT494_00705 [Gammaproteobacteria bacterium]|nr:hypothetical protein [Gammaproteobacteria bacterium]
MQAQDDIGIEPRLRDEVLLRLGCATPLRPDAAGLGTLYRSWCLQVPFDNIRKMIALGQGGEAPLPGGDATDFFEHWLAAGTGGTCWTTSNALCVLARSLGFDAWRVAGSMRDLGIINHGSVLVRGDDGHWLLDTSIMYNEPAPIGTAPFSRDGAFPVEVEPSADGGFLLWVDVPPGPGYTCCRLNTQRVSHAQFLANYEVSRERSPFNTRLYARRNRPEALVLLSGSQRYVKTASGVTRQELAPEELVQALRDEIGIAPAVVAAWVAAGGLESSYRPQHNPAAPAPSEPPSRRRP